MLQKETEQTFNQFAPWKLQTPNHNEEETMTLQSGKFRFKTKTYIVFMNL